MKIFIFFFFLVVKFSVYLNRCVFVMPDNAIVTKHSPSEAQNKDDDDKMKNKKRQKKNATYVTTDVQRRTATALPSHYKNTPIQM